MVSLGAVDNGKTVDVVEDDVILLDLAENPTTGYRWFLGPVDHTLVETGGDAFVPGPGPAMGGAGVRRFRFRAKAGGTTPITLKHWREWSGDESVTERFALQIRVRTS